MNADAPIKFCPFCGSPDLKFLPGPMPRCMTCRTVFLISYTRNVRKSPGKKISPLSK